MTDIAALQAEILQSVCCDTDDCKKSAALRQAAAALATIGVLESLLDRADKNDTLTHPEEHLTHASEGPYVCVACVRAALSPRSTTSGSI